MNGITDKHVLAGLFAFFGLMLAANGVFVYFAITTFSGLSTSNAYRKGLIYNETIAAFRAQQAEGWRAQVAFNGSLVRLEILDAEGLAVNGLEVLANLGRPASDAADRTLAFRGAGQGLYLAEAGVLEAGQWQLAAEARPHGAADAAPYRIGARLWVKP